MKMRWLLISWAWTILLLSACSGGAEEVPIESPVLSSTPDGTNRDFGQNEGPLLREGEFIDSQPIRGQSGGAVTVFPLPTAVARADAIVVVEILEVLDKSDHTSPIRDETGAVIREILVSPITTYRGQVTEWIKGSGNHEIVISWWRGLTPDGPRFSDGGFLPQEGRKYLLLLSPKTPGIPGAGAYETSGFAGYEVTDGFVHVLNHPLWQDLQEEYGGMPLADFVQVLKGFVANPP